MNQSHPSPETGTTATAAFTFFMVANSAGVDRRKKDFPKPLSWISRSSVRFRYFMSVGLCSRCERGCHALHAAHRRLLTCLCVEATHGLLCVGMYSCGPTDSHVRYFCGPIGSQARRIYALVHHGLSVRLPAMRVEVVDP